jgi:hypothetical protein
MKTDDSKLQIIGEKYISLHDVLNERALRLWCASEARALGFGGKAIVHKATGV